MADEQVEVYKLRLEEADKAEAEGDSLKASTIRGQLYTEIASLLAPVAKGLKVGLSPANIAELKLAKAAAAAEAKAIEQAKIDFNVSKDDGFNPHIPTNPNAPADRAIADKIRQDIEAGVVNPHYMAKHGPYTTVQQQYNRAMNGTNPQTGGRGSPTDASRFFNFTDMKSALRQAEAMYAANPSKYVDGTPVSITFNRPVGDGFMGRTRFNDREGVSGQYRWTNTINVGIDRSTGRPYTAYPNLKDGQVMPNPLPLRRQ